ncbi:MAG: 3-dehydroquinate synthase [Parcubacteria group bacterium GW2011_GWA2_51_10]|nr:MAG: 3-dehydroquinate synthase [Parcubacteria group bacterium GW2011_GWA2_51_10]
MSRSIIDITSPDVRSYSILIGTGIGQKIAETISQEAAGMRVAVITDSGVRAILGEQFLRALKTAGLSAEIFEFRAGEESKNQDTITALQHALLEKRYGRDTLIVALGGGVVGDVAGFVAATYLRGVPWINVPTTLLAMVDSAIGGKVGIDTPYGKNTIGAFWMPRAVLMEIEYLSQLPAKEILNGLFEAVKTFFTSDKDSLALVERLDPAHPAEDLANLAQIVEASVRIKEGITKRDLREESERKIINFGHTIGHAIELLSRYKLPHGYSIAWGMLVEAKISELLGHLSEGDSRLIFATLSRLGIQSADFPSFNPEEIIEATKGDKKVRGGKPHYVLLERIGSVYVKDGLYAHPVDDEVVKRALQSL